jgi:predicted NBD/HSP70 family sugar kinase
MDRARPGLPLHRLRVETAASLGYEHIISQITSLVGGLERASGLSRPARIGIGTPGVIEPATGRMKNSNTTCLNGRSLRDDLEKALGCGVAMANDANCFALAEARWGAGRGAGVVLGLILGTGVGGGIVVFERLLEGLHGIAGEWGHNPLRGESHPCYCGRTGCIETVISGPALQRFYHSRGGEALGLPQIAERARQGDGLAIETLARLTAKFGEAIAAVVNILDPDVIVIGGGVGNLPVLYGDETRGAILQHLFNAELHTQILAPQLGDSAGVFGAALLVDQLPLVRAATG